MNNNAWYTHTNNIPSNYLKPTNGLDGSMGRTHRPNGTKYMSTREVYKAFGVDYDKDILGKEK